MKVADLLKKPLIRRLAFSRALRPTLLMFTLGFFIFLLTAAFFGTPLGNRNAAIVLIWIFWFAGLMLVLIPLGGRIWCLICPLPALSEWISRRRIVAKRGQILNLGHKWPKELDNIWLQNGAFLAVAVFSPLILTRPSITGFVLLLFILLAITADLTFRTVRAGRIFCRFLCPIGGFIGLYSSLGALEVRSVDKGVCRSCHLKTCMHGNDKGYGCPWLIYPGGLKKNAYCGLCLECIKTCAYENTTLRTRAPGKDLLDQPRLDEAFKGFIMLGSAGVYTASYFGWWPGLKDLIVFTDDIFLASGLSWTRVAYFAVLLIGTALALLPSIHLAAAWLSKRLSGSEKPLKELFIGYAYFTVPLGFMAWAGFVIGMLFINGSYILSSLSDPLGFGWDLFGTANTSWTPVFTRFVPWIQMGLLLLGGLFSGMVVHKVSRDHFKKGVVLASIPVLLEVSLLTGLMIYINAI